MASAVRETLCARFAALPPLGWAYVDGAVKLQLVPPAWRAAAKSLRMISQDSRLALPDPSAPHLDVRLTPGVALDTGRAVAANMPAVRPESP